MSLVFLSFICNFVRIMANDFFQFKQFTVHQERCAMKVGTDGTLLGAWAHGGRRILDIGTGTGLISLMMAQRNPEAVITAVDIDPDACLQARANVAVSPFAHQIIVVETDISSFRSMEKYDAIVSNPPYFHHSLTCPDEQRTLARHTAALSFTQLMNAADRLLTDNGVFSLVIPAECKALLESEAALLGFFKTRECSVKTTPRKQPRRFLMEFRKHRTDELDCTEGILEVVPNVRSDWYQQLTKDFYL